MNESKLMKKTDAIDTAYKELVKAWEWDDKIKFQAKAQTVLNRLVREIEKER